jgi:hypothetical protein
MDASSFESVKPNQNQTPEQPAFRRGLEIKPRRVCQKGNGLHQILGCIGLKVHIKHLHRTPCLHNKQRDRLFLLTEPPMELDRGHRPGHKGPLKLDSLMPKWGRKDEGGYGYAHKLGREPV